MRSSVFVLSLNLEGWIELPRGAVSETSLTLAELKKCLSLSALPQSPRARLLPAQDLPGVDDVSVLGLAGPQGHHTVGEGGGVRGVIV